MKTLLTLFVLLFTSSVVADDISDFQIEGMSIGDSLLDYFSEEEIKENERNYNQEIEFKSSEFVINTSSKEYDLIGVYYKSSDKKYIIASIIGYVFYSKNNSKNCILKKDKIIDEISVLLNNNEWNNNEYSDGDGFFTFSSLEFKSGRISVSCYDWNTKIEKKLNWTDHLRVEIETNEIVEWVDNIDTTYYNN